ncbi:MAG: BMC domain-containing protein [Propionibacteriaceae bacterium]|nr:BMC domain-containing protein [Propionibacteriaceae bacterium]
MKALGSIEVVGLVAGVEAADVACKAADVQLVGYELAKGGGYVAVKVLGEVAAVKAAIDAAEVAAARISRVVGTLVIPRPSEQLEPLICSPTTVGLAAPSDDESGS